MTIDRVRSSFARTWGNSGCRTTVIEVLSTGETDAGLTLVASQTSEPRENDIEFVLDNGCSLITRVGSSDVPALSSWLKAEVMQMISVEVDSVGIHDVSYASLKVILNELFSSSTGKFEPVNLT